MNRIDRLFAILLLIQCKRRMRALDLAQAFEISERTINRDMATLNESDVPIMALPGAGYESKLLKYCRNRPCVIDVLLLTSPGDRSYPAHRRVVLCL